MFRIGRGNTLKDSSKESGGTGFVSNTYGTALQLNDSLMQESAMIVKGQSTYRSANASEAAITVEDDNLSIRRPEPTGNHMHDSILISKFIRDNNREADKSDLSISPMRAGKQGFLYEPKQHFYSKHNAEMKLADHTPVKGHSPSKSFYTLTPNKKLAPQAVNSKTLNTRTAVNSLNNTFASHKKFDSTSQANTMRDTSTVTMKPAIVLTNRTTTELERLNQTQKSLLTTVK